MNKRADFLAAAQSQRASQASMIVQARHRGPEAIDPAIARVGYTCSKKVGNAVARNRAKRRLRAAARSVLAQQGRPGWDYVLIGRAGITAGRPFELLCQDLTNALKQLHSRREARPS